MPLVRIDIMEGRPPEKIRELHSRVAALVAEILDTPIERVRTYITQFPPEGWGIGGVPADVSRADEVAARRAAFAERAVDLQDRCCHQRGSISLTGPDAPRGTAGVICVDAGIAAACAFSSPAGDS